MEPDAVEIRVLGCLIEKQRTTPDVYPLTLNALRLACNQSTNRDPVVDYDENVIRGAIERLVQRKWATLDRALELSGADMAVLGVLMLRGPQTPGELKTRTERLHGFADMSDLAATLDGLISRDLVARLDRRPGQREERYQHRLAEDAEEAAPAAPAERPTAAPPAERPAAAPPAEQPTAAPPAERPAAAPSAEQPTAAPPAERPAAAASAEPEVVAADDERIQRIERQLAELRSEIRALREELGA